MKERTKRRGQKNSLEKVIKGKKGARKEVKEKGKTEANFLSISADP